MFLRNIESSSQFNESDNSDIKKIFRALIKRSRKDAGKKIAAILEIHSFKDDVKICQEAF
jgi:tellurite resistance protein